MKNLNYLQRQQIRMNDTSVWIADNRAGGSWSGLFTQIWWLRFEPDCLPWKVLPGLSGAFLQDRLLMLWPQSWQEVVTFPSCAPAAFFWLTDWGSWAIWSFHFAWTWLGRFLTILFWTVTGRPSKWLKSGSRRWGYTWPLEPPFPTIYSVIFTPTPVR